MPRPATANSTHTLLNRLERLRSTFSVSAAKERASLVRTLSQSRILSASDLIRYHDLLCVIRAYPDNATVFDLAETELRHFGRRVGAYKKLSRDKKASKLDDTGIDGSITCYQFNYDITRYLLARYPGSLRINWKHCAEDIWSRLANLVNQLVSWEENDPIDNDEEFDIEQFFRLSGGDKNELQTLVNLFAGSGLPPRVIRDQWESLGLLIDWDLTGMRSSRSSHRVECKERFYQDESFRPRSRDVRLELAAAPTPLRHVTRREGELLLNDINEALGIRNRELFPLTFGNPSEVYTFDCGRGCRIVLYGSLPEARLPLESNFGALLVRNGMPVGYGVAALLFDRTEIAINIFPTFRGGESPHFFEQFFRIFYHHFDSRVFVVRARQMGYGEDEALLSGAFWFYYKIGFRAMNKRIRKLSDELAAKMVRRPGFRVPVSTMRTLSETDVFLTVDPTAMKEYHELSIINLGYRITEMFGKQYAGDRIRGIDTAVQSISRTLGIANTARWSDGEKLALTRLAPLVDIIPDIPRWSVDDRRLLVDVIRAKGGMVERQFVTLMNRHAKFKAALEKMAKQKV